MRALRSSALQEAVGAVAAWSQRTRSERWPLAIPRLGAGRSALGDARAAPPSPSAHADLLACSRKKVAQTPGVFSGLKSLQRFSVQHKF